MGPKLEDFEIIGVVGTGTSGTVRKVRRRVDGKVLVWKELHYVNMTESEKQALVQEVNLLRELRHPHIVRFLHHIVDRRSGTLYIIMEHCPRGDLGRLIARCRSTGAYLEETFIWRILKQLSAALRACHTGQRLVLHRDIKPANVFLDQYANVKLGDFGLARTLSSRSSFATSFVGTPYYMSPEVVDGREYNEKSDMWSLGCLLYELCALRPPFTASSHQQLALKIKAGKFERIPPQFSDDLWEVIQLLLMPEDFLRPTALMIQYHRAVQAHSSPTSSGEQPLVGSPSYPSDSLTSGGNVDSPVVRPPSSSPTFRELASSPNSFRSNSPKYLHPVSSPDPCSNGKIPDAKSFCTQPKVSVCASVSPKVGVCGVPGSGVVQQTDLDESRPAPHKDSNSKRTNLVDHKLLKNNESKSQSENFSDTCNLSSDSDPTTDSRGYTARASATSAKLSCAAGFGAVRTVELSCHSNDDKPTAVTWKDISARNECRAVRAHPRLPGICENKSSEEFVMPQQSRSSNEELPDKSNYMEDSLNPRVLLEALERAREEALARENANTKTLSREDINEVGSSMDGRQFEAINQVMRTHGTSKLICHLAATNLTDRSSSSTSLESVKSIKACPAAVRQTNGLQIEVLATSPKAVDVPYFSAGFVQSGEVRNKRPSVSPTVIGCSQPTTSSDLGEAKIPCACEGMSKLEWRRRINSLREAEKALRDRERHLEERDREIYKRERRALAMEQDARQHLVRAQIFLRQARGCGSTDQSSTVAEAAVSPSASPMCATAFRYCTLWSDSVTTVSADPGDEEVRTAAPSALLNRETEVKPVQLLPSRACIPSSSDSCVMAAVNGVEKELGFVRVPSVPCDVRKTGRLREDLILREKSATLERTTIKKAKAHSAVVKFDVAPENMKTLNPTIKSLNNNEKPKSSLKVRSSNIFSSFRSASKEKNPKPSSFRIPLLQSRKHMKKANSSAQIDPALDKENSRPWSYAC